MRTNDTTGMKLISADGHEFTKSELHRMLYEDNEPIHHVVKKNYYYKDKRGNSYKYDDIYKKGYVLVNNVWTYSRQLTILFQNNLVVAPSNMERVYYFNDSYPVDELQDEDIFNSGFFGFVVGDTLGVPYEFKTREVMKQNPMTDMIENGTHHMPMGTWSDDTSMTVATMASMIDKQGIDFNDIMIKFLEWYKRHFYTATDCVFDVGSTVMAALDEYQYGKEPVNCGRKSESSNGNGSLMRMFPIAYYIWKNGLRDEDATKLINDVSSLTHAHPISQLGCRIYCDYLTTLMDTKDKYYAYYVIQNKNYEKYYPKEVVEKYKRILDGSIIVEPRESISGSGYIVSTLEAAIWASFNSNDYTEAVTKAINLGDDTDTVGAITGSIAGVMYGLENIPEKWLDALKKKEQLEQISSFFIQSIQNSKEIQREEEQVVRK